MQTERKDFESNDKDELHSAIRDVAGTLPDSAVEDFLNAQPPSALALRSHRGWLVFDCQVRKGCIEPLNQADCDHPLWKVLSAKLAAAGTRNAALMLPEHLVLLVEASREQPARVLAIPDNDIISVLQAYGRNEQPTSSELRLLKQLICGMSLSEAAKTDGVSHETKRSQYKSLARKLSVRSQNELANKLLTQLLLDPHASADDKAAEADEYFIELMSTFIPSARCFQLRGTNGVRHRFVDIGPVSGRPIAFVHPQILPSIRPEDMAILHDKGLRLIAPLRNGAMAKAAVRLSIADHLDHACEGIELVRTHFAGEKLDLIACISGCAYGIEYAKRHPDRVRSLAFVGACVRPTIQGGVSGRLRAGLFTLATANWNVYSATLAFFCRRLRQPESCRRLLDKHYRPSPADSMVVREEHALAHAGERTRRLFTASVESMTHDFYHQAVPRWQELPRLYFPVAFFHGDQDFIHNIRHVRALAESLGQVPVHAIPGAGQLLYHKHFQPMVTGCSAFFENLPVRLPSGNPLSN